MYNKSNDKLNVLDENKLLKELEESSKSYNQLQNKNFFDSGGNTSSSYNNTNNNDKIKKEEEQEEEGQEEEKESKKSGLSFLGDLFKKVGSGSLIAGGATVGGIGVISTLLIGMYRIHYDGEFEFKGIGAEYQTFSFKKMNFLSFNDSGDIELGGLTKENKLVKAYYTYYSDNSYFAVVEDSNKYKDDMDKAYSRKNLLTPKELREKYPDIEDVEGREKMFQLNPDVLYSLDKYLHKDKFIYPQQFVKPVYYEESKENFELKSLTNKQGALVTKSQVFSSSGKPALDSNGKLKRETGLWDYGLASVLRYKEYEVKERVVTTVSEGILTYNGYSSPEGKNEDSSKVSSTKVNKESASTVVEKYDTSNTSSETTRDKPAYAIDVAVTAGGTIESKVAQKWQEKAGSRRSVNKKETFYEEEKYTYTEKVSKLDPETMQMVTEEVEKEGVKKHSYTIEYTVEEYTEEYVPYYEGDLDTSKITGSKYYRDYIRNYSNYIPVDAPRELDYSVLDNPEIAQLLYDDDPNNLNAGSEILNGLTKEEFDKAVFMGDSITLGFKAYNIIPEDRVVAVGGYNTVDALKLVDDVVSKNPPVVIITYGTNDCNVFSKEKYASQYSQIIKDIKSKLPNVKIYINKTFPTLDTRFKKIADTNSMLPEVASSNGATLVDCTNIVQDKYYNDDGIHFKKDFYPLWLAELEKKMVNTSANNLNNNTNLSGQTFKAEFRAYQVGQGGKNDMKGVPLDPSKNTCAVPMKSIFPNSVMEYGTRFVINGTGTFKDGTICTANDNGGTKSYPENKISIFPDGTYGIDILVANSQQENAIGVKRGTITILDSGTAPKARSMEDVFPGNQAVRSFVSDKSRTSSLMLNTGGNAVTNYSTTIDDYAKARSGGKCDSGTCSVENYKKNLEPDAFKDEVGDLRHLRIDIFRPVDETAFATKFAEKFDKKIAPYALSFINACKEKNIDVLAVVAQIANESGWGRHAIVGNIGGSTYYNFTGIGAVDGNAYQGGLNYAKKKGWDTPEKAVLGAVEFLANDYIHSQTNQQNTLYKISFPFIGKPNGHFYASNPDYAYALASIMNSWTHLYSSGATFYYDMPTFDPSKPAGTTEGAGHGAQVGGGSSMGSASAIGAFNSYLASNWSTFLEKKEILYPWTKDLDKDLEKEMKGYYGNLKDEKLAIRNKNKYTVNLTKTDEEIILNMMFALNQGNYLSKYDYMGEAEWKAMYNQLLSSPTGKTWDDKWIGYNCEDVFDMKLEDLGTLFKEGSGANPTVSRPFGKLMNVYSDDISVLPQYNEMNFGIDITVPKDTEVLSIADGEVIGVGKKSEPTSRYGRYVMIKYNNNTRVTIANFDKIDKKIKNGAKVKKGQVLGTTGGTCRSYKEGDLHLEVLFKDNYINPEWILTRDMKGFEDPIESNANDGGVNCNSNTSVSNSALINSIIDEGKKYLGVKYVFGSQLSDAPNSFDCSSFISYIMIQNGVEMSRHTAHAFKDASTPITREELQPGDLIFWVDLRGSAHDPICHIAMYIGNNELIEACYSKRQVVIQNLDSRLKPGIGFEYQYGRFPLISSGESSGSVTNSTPACTPPNQSPTVDNGSYLWPVPTAKSISSPFGYRIHPVLGVRKLHTGIDIPAKTGTPVVATRGGTVKISGVQGSYGLTVKIDHGDGTSSLYAHNSKLKVSVGDTVVQGQEISLIGSTGRSTGPHLHFEIRENDTPKNPMDYVTNK